MAFTNLLELAAEADRQTISEIAEKNPWLKKYAEKGEAIEKLEPRVKGLYDDGSVEKVVTELERWRHWNQTDWVAHQNQTRQAQELLAAAQAKVRELENRSDVEMTPEEIRQLVMESVKSTLADAGLVDAKGLEAKLTDLVEKQVKPQIEASSNGLTNRFEDVYAVLTPKMLEHKENFGETLNMKDLFKYMKETQQMDPVKAYDSMVAPKLQEKQTKEWEAKVADAEKRGEQKGRVEGRKENQPGRTSPVDGRGGIKVGPVQQMQLSRFSRPPKEGEKVPEPPLGKGIIAQKAAEEHFQKQNSAGVV